MRHRVGAGVGCRKVRRYFAIFIGLEVGNKFTTRPILNKIPAGPGFILRTASCQSRDLSKSPVLSPSWCGQDLELLLDFNTLPI